MNKPLIMIGILGSLYWGTALVLEIIEESPGWITVALFSLCIYTVLAGIEGSSKPDD